LDLISPQISDGRDYSAIRKAVAPLPTDLRPIARSRPLPRWLLPSLFERSEALGAGGFRPFSKGARIGAHVLPLA
jgi:hypothetical protein